jgi:serine phosphatase RsbU (regulator of sigma subunit)
VQYFSLKNPINTFYISFMITAPLPENEDARLAELLKYNVLDTPPEDAFDELVKLAANICDTQISLVSLIDKDRQWFKARVGLDAEETPRDIAFCSHAILQDDVFEVQDARKDERFHDNPLVTGGPEIQFYAGIPLETPSGHKMGTLCVIDQEAKQLDPSQKEALSTLGKQVVKQMELSLKIRELHASEQQTSKAKEKIEKSIQYGQRIQNAMLTPEEDIRKYVAESFVFFQPKDIVSGDFYFFTIKGGLVYIAVADCTGHGVPGAFMSMIGLELLNDLVLRRNVKKADVLLNELHEGVVNALNQHQTKLQDGMDIGVCIFDPATKTAQFSGARRPLYVSSKDQELYKLDGDRASIGGVKYGADRDFSVKTFKYNESDSFYLFTDGLNDQTSNVSFKKVGRKSMEQLVGQIGFMDMENQKETVTALFEEVIDSKAQVDDMTMIGFKPKFDGIDSNTLFGNFKRFFKNEVTLEKVNAK